MKQNRGKKRVRWQFLLACTIAVVLTFGILSYREQKVQAQVSKNQRQLAGEVLRFHVLADSDSKVDQELKMRVKSDVLDYLKTIIPEGSNLDQTKEIVSKHREEIRRCAMRTLAKQQCTDPVSVRIERTCFPEKSYGDVTFPAGNYQALRILIGSGRGQNWWCVLYPSLCFMDATNAVVPQKGKQELKAVLSAQEYDMITAEDQFKIRWFFLGQ